MGSIDNSFREELRFAAQSIARIEAYEAGREAILKAEFSKSVTRNLLKTEEPPAIAQRLGISTELYTKFKAASSEISLADLAELAIALNGTLCVEISLPATVDNPSHAP